VDKIFFKLLRSPKLVFEDWAAFVTASVRLSEFSGWYKRQTARAAAGRGLPVDQADPYGVFRA
jgi:hypothetical protein